MFHTVDFVSVDISDIGITLPKHLFMAGVRRNDYIDQTLFQYRYGHESVVLGWT